MYFNFHPFCDDGNMLTMLTTLLYIHRVFGFDYMSDLLAYQCFNMFLKLLHSIPAAKMDPNTQCKVKQTQNTKGDR